MVREARGGGEEAAAEMTVNGGCLMCGGDVRLRITSAGARTVCTHCEWIGRPEVKRVKGGIHVNYTPVAES